MNIRPYTSTEDSLSPNNNLPYCLSTESGCYCTFRHLVTSVSGQQSHACWHSSSPTVLSIQVKERVAAFRYAALVGLPASFTYTPTSGRVMYLQIELNHTDTNSFTTLRKTHFMPIINSNV